MERAKGVAVDDERQHEQELFGIKLRRGLAAGKKGGPCTPVPAWKFEDPVAEDSRSLDGHRPSSSAATAAAPVRQPAVSARKLGAGLWEVQDVLPLSRMSRRMSRRGRDPAAEDLADVSPRGEPQSAGSFRRHAATSSTHHHNLNERYSKALQPFSPTTYSSSMEVGAFNQVASPSRSLDHRGKLGESGYSIKTSTELLKVLNRIWTLEEQHSSNISEVKTLKTELEHARLRIRELKQEQQAYRREMDDLMNHVAEDKAVRKTKERDKIKAAVKSIREELEDERRLRRHSESLHRKLGKELSEVKASYSKALKHLEGERRANSLLEDLCDEFAKGVGDYEQEVRELKQKAAIDFERKTDGLVLHVSEAWLDERLQLKNAEARGDAAEKSAILNRLSSEITTFLQARRSTNSNGDMRRQSRESVHLNGATSAPQAGEDDDSVASDLHCFELSMISANNGGHGPLKSHREECREVLESMRKSNFTRKKGQSSSNCEEEHTDRIKSCNGSKAPHTDAETRGMEPNHIKFLIAKESENFDDEDGDGKLKWTGMHRTDEIDSELYEGGMVHHDDHRGDDSRSRFSWRGHFAPIGEDSVPVDFPTLSSRWNRRHMSPGLEISECSSSLLKGAKENTLKAKLLEARLEGQQARFKVSKGSSSVC